MNNNLQIGNLGENKLIKLIGDLILKKTGKVLLSDDSFFFSPKSRNLVDILVLNSDMLVSTTDVPPLMNFYQTGKKSVIMNISDLLVKGVQPRGIIISLGLPKELKKAEDGRKKGKLRRGQSLRRKPASIKDKLSNISSTVEKPS